jgi:hypothetical protein
MSQLIAAFCVVDIFFCLIKTLITEPINLLNTIGWILSIVYLTLIIWPELFLYIVELFDKE